MWIGNRADQDNREPQEGALIGLSSTPLGRLTRRRTRAKVWCPARGQVLPVLELHLHKKKRVVLVGQINHLRPLQAQTIGSPMSLSEMRISGNDASALRSSCLHRFPDPLRSGGTVDVDVTERRHRVVDRIGDSRERSNGTGLTAPFDA